MGMTIYTAHVYVKSEKNTAYFELAFENEAEPELVVKDSLIQEFIAPETRRKLISDAFDSNLLWEDDEPHTLIDEISDQDWDDESVSEEFNSFCETVQGMGSIVYVLFAVDSDQEYWRDYNTYWYDAKAIDFKKNKLITIEWRGKNVATIDSWPDPFNEKVAKSIVKAMEDDTVAQIDTGDFKPGSSLGGKVTEKELGAANQSNNNAAEVNYPQAGSMDSEEAAQIERIYSLVKTVDEIDFTNKAFVFDRLDYELVDGEYCGPDSPNNPIIKRVIEKGGLMRKAVSGKTDYLVLNNYAAMSSMGKKCKDALAQIDKGKNLTIITLDNLMHILG